MCEYDDFVEELVNYVIQEYTALIKISMAETMQSIKRRNKLRRMFREAEKRIVLSDRQMQDSETEDSDGETDSD